MFQKRGVKIQCTTTKYKHMHTAFIVALNKLLAESLFKVEDTQELSDLEMVSLTWVKYLYELTD